MVGSRGTGGLGVIGSRRWWGSRMWCRYIYRGDRDLGVGGDLGVMGVKGMVGVYG